MGQGGPETRFWLIQAPPLGEARMVVGSFWGMGDAMASPSLGKEGPEVPGPNGAGHMLWPCP